MEENKFETGLRRVEDILKSAKENLRSLEKEVEGLVANLEKDHFAGSGVKAVPPRDRAAR